MNKGNVVVIVLILASLGLLGGYFLKTKSEVSTPTSVTTYPDATQNVVSEKMTLTAMVDANGLVTGQTKANAEVFINDQMVKADAQGNFSLKLILDEGENIVIVSANDSDGNVVEQNLNINIE